jgi:hypothetical protein
VEAKRSYMTEFLSRIGFRAKESHEENGYSISWIEKLQKEKTL